MLNMVRSEGLRPLVLICDELRRMGLLVYGRDFNSTSRNAMTVKCGTHAVLF